MALKSTGETYELIPLVSWYPVSGEGDTERPLRAPRRAEIGQDDIATRLRQAEDDLSRRTFEALALEEIEQQVEGLNLLLPLLPSSLVLEVEPY